MEWVFDWSGEGGNQRNKARLINDLRIFTTKRKGVIDAHYFVSVAWCAIQS